MKIVSSTVMVPRWVSCFDSESFKNVSQSRGYGCLPHLHRSIQSSIPILRAVLEITFNILAIQSSKYLNLGISEVFKEIGFVQMR